MGNEKVDPWALLREARESVQLLANKLYNELDYGYSEEQEQLCSRIDTALAQKDAEVVWSRSRDRYWSQIDSADVQVQFLPSSKNWHWEVVRYGFMPTEEEAKKAAIDAAKGK